MSQAAAAKALHWSTRWVRKKFKRYLALGDQGLVHLNRNKSSKKGWEQKQKEFAMSLFEDKFQGFGPTFAAEKLDELYDIKASKETVRKAMIAYGH